MKAKRSLDEEVLRLPRRRRQALFEKIEISLIDDDVLLAGAELSEQRWQAYLRGESGAKPAREGLNEVMKKKRKK